MDKMDFVNKRSALNKLSPWNTKIY